MSRSRLVYVICSLAAALCLAAMSASVASAASPEWELRGFAPEGVEAGKEARVMAWIINTGEVPLTGTLTVTDIFPSQLSAVEPNSFERTEAPHTCQLVGQESTCEFDVQGLVPGGQIMLQYIFSAGVLGPIVDPGATGTFTNRIIAEGGGMAGHAAEVQQPMSVIASIPPFQIKRFAVGSLPEPAGVPSHAAGTAPYELETAIGFGTFSAGQIGIGGIAETNPPEHLRDATVHLPVGLIGNPTAVARCSAVQFAEQYSLAEPGRIGVEVNNCPPDSQVGTVRLLSGGLGSQLVPIYNLVPPPGYPAALGFIDTGISTIFLAHIRPGDNGVDITSVRTPSSLSVSEVDTSIWGVPSDPRHQYLRHTCDGYFQGNIGGRKCPAISPPAPFLRLPTSCPGTEPSWDLELDTYENPGVIHTAHTTTPATEACSRDPFEPTITLFTPSSSPGSPTGLDATVKLPQLQLPYGLAEADLRRATVTLPEGMAINPSSATGLAACSDAQLRLGISGPAECPDASKIGSVNLKTPLLDHPLSGSVFIRSQGSGTPDSGDLYRLALEIRSDDDGVDIKLPGQLKVDSSTGQITTVFDELPQLPFESMQLHLDAGPRAPLSLPPTCGEYRAQATFTGWNGAEVTTNPKFSVDQNCIPRPFAPGFEAGVANSTAGRFAPFALRVTRDPGQPNLSRIDATLPEGELAKLAGVPLCPDALAGSGACPAGSRVGHVVAAVGDGSSPLVLPQPGKKDTAVYLGGAYRGAPYSVIASVPAQAGPFDLGTVVVRSAVRIDSVTTRVSVQSDPLPQIYAGIPVSYRDVRVEVDRPNFTLNPTDCEPMSVDAAIFSAQGQSAAAQQHFQVTDCANLGFKPSLALKLAGKTKRTGHPALKAILTYPGHGSFANIARAQVGLPHSEFLDQGNIGTVCTQPQLRSKSCPAKSVYGRAKAWTPLLDHPLEGPVYLGVGYGHKLPDLVADLDGQIRVLLNGKVDTDKQKGLRNTFAMVPDAPVSRFVLELKGGKKYGLLENSENLCAHPARAQATFTAQNGKVAHLHPKLQVSCGKTK